MVVEVLACQRWVDFGSVRVPDGAGLRFWLLQVNIGLVLKCLEQILRLLNGIRAWLQLNYCLLRTDIFSQAFIELRQNKRFIQIEVLQVILAVALALAQPLELI